MQPRNFQSIDHDGFARELRQLRKEVDGQLGSKDLAHLRKIEAWGRLSSVVGYATAWMFPNPLAAFFISLGIVTRWTMMMHHVGHKGYDKVPNVPRRYTSAVFAQGWRRWLDFPDWIETKAWLHEHNLLHHYHTGEQADPDLVQRNLMALRMLPGPTFPKYPVVLFFSLVWKWFYYASSTLRAQQLSQQRAPGEDVATAVAKGLGSSFDPRGGDGHLKVWRILRAFWDIPPGFLFKCFFPYVAYRFVLIPGLFLAISPTAAFNVLLTTVMAELMTNLHSFLVIVPNHCGDDLYQFETAATDKAEFFMRQVLGSVEYRTGGDLNDFLHGFLNYQIEHHLWPDLPMLRYQQLQPKVKEICQRYGVPYVQESVWRRAWKTARVMTGAASMPVGLTAPRAMRGHASAKAASAVASVVGPGSPGMEAAPPA